mgnify:CR=1 FL=1
MVVALEVAAVLAHGLRLNFQTESQTQTKNKTLNFKLRRFVQSVGVTVAV